MFPQWIWWLVGGLGAYWFDNRQQRIAALQSIDVGLLIVKSETDVAAAGVQNGSALTLSDGASIHVESTLSADQQSAVQALGKTKPASQWLALASALQAANLPLAANSVATQGMTYIENGVIGAP